jgi:hypothetical protein
MGHEHPASAFDHPRVHGPSHQGHPGHHHGGLDPSLVANERGLWAVKWSFVGEVEHELRDRLKFVSGVIVHVDPVEESGESHHRLLEQAGHHERP